MTEDLTDLFRGLHKQGAEVERKPAHMGGLAVRLRAEAEEGEDSDAA